MTADISVEESIKQAMEEIDGKEASEEEEQEEVVEEPEEKESEEKEPEEKEEVPTEEPEEAPPEPVTAAPQAWSGAVKEKWATLPRDVQAEIAKRENDIHQMLTRHDGELSMGRQMKEVISPYMPIIQAEGGNPVSAVQNLLNTAYQLRTAQPAQKVALLQNIAQQYGVDLSQAVQPQENVDPYVKQLEQRIGQFEQQFTQQMSLQQQEEAAKIQNEIEAFAADPKNTYFEQVRTQMGTLLSSGQAKDMQEAYDMACWSNPNVRSTLLKAQEAEEAKKRKAEAAKKKQAAASLTGSPGVNTNSGSKQSNKTIEEELAEVYDDLVGSKI